MPYLFVVAEFVSEYRLVIYVCFLSCSKEISFTAEVNLSFTAEAVVACVSPRDDMTGGGVSRQRK